MILLSVGTQFPFDRLTQTVDTWAWETGRTDVVAQIGPSSYQPRALKTFNMISPDKFAALQTEAGLIVAHAGMGSILGAVEASTPIIIMPRDYQRGEHRNDHQLATARHFDQIEGVYVAYDEVALRELLDKASELKPAPSIDGSALARFSGALRNYIEEEPSRRSLAARVSAMLRSPWG